MAEKWLIDANSILDEFLKRYTEMERDGNLIFSACEIKQDFADMISNAPTVDAVEVVRCRDCKHQTAMWCWRAEEGMNPRRVGSNDFCSYGERKDGD